MATDVGKAQAKAIRAIYPSLGVVTKDYLGLKTLADIKYYVPEPPPILPSLFNIHLRYGMLN